MKKKMKQYLLFLAAAMLCVTGCGSSAKETSASYDAGAGYYDDYAYSSTAMAEAAMEEAPAEMWDDDMEYKKAEEPFEEPLPVADNSPVSLSNDKLVYSCSIEMESTEYKETVKQIRELIRSADAIIEAESESDSDNRWYYSGHTKTSGSMRLNLTIRVPAANYEGFVEDISEVGKVLSKSQSVDNISRQYHDTQARIEALTKEEERLNSMIDLAETIEEMIFIEERLTEVEAQLNSYKTNLAAMDVDVAYSTVRLTLREVMIYTPEERPTITFGERLARTFENSWEGFADFLEGLLFALIYLLPFLITGAIVAGIVIFIVRKADKRTPEQRKADKLAKKERKAQEKAMKAQMKAMRRGRTIIPPVPPRAPEPPAAAEPEENGNEKN